MNIFDGIEKLITEHGSAAILSERLAFAKDQFEQLERKVSDLQTQTGRLEAQLEREQSDHKKDREELQRLKNEHAEEVRVYGSVEFRRGKRTGGVWIAFCPACHTLADQTGGFVKCADPKCGWEAILADKQVAEMITKL